MFLFKFGWLGGRLFGGGVAARSAYCVFSRYRCLVVGLVYPATVLGWGFFLIAPFPDHCLLVPISESTKYKSVAGMRDTPPRKFNLADALNTLRSDDNWNLAQLFTHLLSTKLLQDLLFMLHLGGKILE